MTRTQKYNTREPPILTPRLRQKCKFKRMAPNISGTWRLDKQRSEPIDHYLSAMGLCQIAIDGHRQKEAASETFYVISQTASALEIKKHSWSGTSERHVAFGKSVEGGKRVSASIRGDAVVVTTEMDGRVLHDIKTLHDNGTTLRMHLSLLTPDSQIDIERWLVSSELDDDDDDT